VGEFQGIAGEIEQDLAQPAGVAGKLGRVVRGDGADQFEIFLVHVEAHHVDDTVEEFMQVERNVFEFQLPCFDFGKIENIVDYGKKRPAAVLQDFHILFLRLVQRGIGKQGGYADDAVHRRADFMAHVGQKLAFRPVGAFGLFFCQSELLRTFMDQFLKVVPVFFQLRLIFMEIGGHVVKGLAHLPDFIASGQRDSCAEGAVFDLAHGIPENGQRFDDRAKEKDIEEKEKEHRGGQDGEDEKDENTPVLGDDFLEIVRDGDKAEIFTDHLDAADVQSGKFAVLLKLPEIVSAAYGRLPPIERLIVVMAGTELPCSFRRWVKAGEGDVFNGLLHVLEG